MFPVMSVLCKLQQNRPWQNFPNKISTFTRLAYVDTNTGKWSLLIFCRASETNCIFFFRVCLLCVYIYKEFIHCDFYQAIFIPSQHFSLTICNILICRGGPSCIAGRGKQHNASLDLWIHKSTAEWCVFVKNVHSFADSPRTLTDKIFMPGLLLLIQSTHSGSHHRRYAFCYAVVVGHAICLKLN